MTNREAIDILTNIKNTPRVTWTNGADTAFDLAIKVLEERQTGEWIPVSERLPDDDSDVIITYVGEMRTLFIEMGWFSEGRFLSQDGKLEMTEVVAWMPLPEPYKKGEEE